MLKTLTYKNATINFTDSGKGSCVVFLHGFLESLDMWDEYSELLSDRYRVICIDLPGFGKSEMVHDIHTMEIYADTTKAVLEHLNIYECVLAGHSMGGYVSLVFAEKYPELLKGLVIFHSHGAEDDPEAKKNRDRAIEIIKQNHVTFVRDFIQNLFAQENVQRLSYEIDIMKKNAAMISPEAIIAAIAGMRDRESKIDVLREINVPVLFIAGKQDSRMPLDKIMDQAKLPMHSEVLLLGNIGHMGFLEAKEECLEKINNFVFRCYKH